MDILDGPSITLYQCNELPSTYLFSSMDGPKTDEIMRLLGQFNHKLMKSIFFADMHSEHIKQSNMDMRLICVQDKCSWLAVPFGWLIFVVDLLVAHLSSIRQIGLCHCIYSFMLGSDAAWITRAQSLCKMMQTTEVSWTTSIHLIR